MGALLLTLWANPLARKIAGVLAIVAVLGVIAWRLVEHGKTLGADSQKQTSRETIEAMRAADREQVGAVIADAVAKQNAAEIRADAAREDARRQAAIVASLAQRQVQASASVAQIPDAGLHSYVVEQLGLRSAGDRTPGYTAGEERGLAECVTKYPICRDQVAAGADETKKVRDEVAGLRDQIAGLQTQVGAVTGYTQRLEGYYTAVWNDAAKKKRAARCVWMWACVAPKLSAPAPAVLFGKK